MNTFLIKMLFFLMVGVAFAQRCPHQVQQECTIQTSCDETCDNQPDKCEDYNGMKGELEQSGCNCCNACVYTASNMDPCGFDNTTGVDVQCRCNFVCVDGVCQPENKEKQ